MNAIQMKEISEDAVAGIYQDLCIYFNAHEMDVPLSIRVMIQAHVDLAVVRTSKGCLLDEISNLKKQLEYGK